MRNTNYFALNIFDESVNSSGCLGMTGIHHLDRTLSFEQETILRSRFLRKISLAGEMWNDKCEEYNQELVEFFRQIGAAEFIPGNIHANFQPFKTGKFWQMIDYLDGRYILRQKNPEETRKEYQNKLLAEAIGGKSHLLQYGWDLAVNSALLCDLMPSPRANGSIYLLENVVEDEDSLFYPTVTNEFQARVVNEAFWQSLFDFSQMKNLPVLERTLTRYFPQLDRSLAPDNILRWSQSGPVVNVEGQPLVMGSCGPESFLGLSRRAVENLGQFLERVYQKYPGDIKKILPFAKAYVQAVTCRDEDGNDYFSGEERTKLLALPFVLMIPEKKDKSLPQEILLQT